MRSLVIGYGSIGERHARILNDLGRKVAVVSRRDVDFPLVYSDLSIALEKESPEYVIVANQTSSHYDTLTDLAKLGFSGTVLVEKPLFSQICKVGGLPFNQVFVGYNLRFHHLIQRLRSALEGERVLSVLAYVGQYLPNWRSSVDYRTSYSASQAHGGGVLRDLSHELDYLTWMLGGWKGVAAVGGHFSSLEIDSDDIFTIMLSTPACENVSLQLNYLDRLGRRFVLVNTDNHTIEIDFVKGRMVIDRDEEIFSADRDDSYKLMHQEILSGHTSDVCSLDEGLRVLGLIEAVELAVKKNVWVNYKMEVNV